MSSDAKTFTDPQSPQRASHSQLTNLTNRPASTPSTPSVDRKRAPSTETLNESPSKQHCSRVVFECDLTTSEEADKENIPPALMEKIETEGVVFDPKSREWRNSATSSQRTTQMNAHAKKIKDLETSDGKKGVDIDQLKAELAEVNQKLHRLTPLTNTAALITRGVFDVRLAARDPSFRGNVRVRKEAAHLVDVRNTCLVFDDLQLASNSNYTKEFRIIFGCTYSQANELVDAGWRDWISLVDMRARVVLDESRRRTANAADDEEWCKHVQNFNIKLLDDAFYDEFEKKKGKAYSSFKGLMTRGNKLL